MVRDRPWSFPFSSSLYLTDHPLTRSRLLIPSLISLLSINTFITSKLAFTTSLVKHTYTLTSLLFLSSSRTQINQFIIEKPHYHQDACNSTTLSGSLLYPTCCYFWKNTIEDPTCIPSSNWPSRRVTAKTKHPSQLCRAIIDIRFR